MIQPYYWNIRHNLIHSGWKPAETHKSISGQVKNTMTEMLGLFPLLWAQRETMIHLPRARELRKRRLERVEGTIKATWVGTVIWKTEWHSTSQVRGAGRSRTPEGIRVPILSSWAILMTRTYINFTLVRDDLPLSCNMYVLYLPNKNYKILENRHSLYFILFSTSKSHSTYSIS